jgi:hypothetical protein
MPTEPGHPVEAGLLPSSRAVQQGTCRWTNEHERGAGQLEEIMTVEYLIAGAWGLRLD